MHPAVPVARHAAGDEAVDADEVQPAPSYTPPSYTPPMTGNFGNGTGTVGYCDDGTLSDSIGRPGACSWHGGVAP